MDINDIMERPELFNSIIADSGDTDTEEIEWVTDESAFIITDEGVRIIFNNL